MHLQFIASHISLDSSATPISDVPAVSIPTFPPWNFIGFLNNNIDDEFFPVLKEMIKEDVDCIIVAAGMEGALATLVSTMVDIPIIGIPTSVGYGYGEKGIAALASMLQSCSLGLSVVNIDNGIAAGGIAANIANRSVRKKWS